MECARSLSSNLLGPLRAVQAATKSCTVAPVTARESTTHLRRNSASAALETPRPTPCAFATESYKDAQAAGLSHLRNTARCRSKMVVPEPLGEVPPWAADVAPQSRRWSCDSSKRANRSQVLASPTSSVASTRTPSPGMPQAVGPVAMWAERVRRAEQAMLQKDLTIECLEERVRQLEQSTQRCGQSSSTSSSLTSIRGQMPYQGDDEASDAGSLNAEMDAAVAKSEALLRRMSALDYSAEPELQWAAMMAAHEESKEKLSQIEQLVQRRIEQLKPGDRELKICRAVRGVCVSSQRSVHGAETSFDCRSDAARDGNACLLDGVSNVHCPQTCLQPSFSELA
ncbi:ecmA [Symbiodinium necroappetens]|uniref:EcmA protein n=1 Tax=Symbiodinium necroappetens TaxID=1628268 RepID=A0A812LLY5_9DINO|nr:ecmA [Symbiodinium necroappetens]